MNRNPNWVQRMRMRNKNPLIPFTARFECDLMGNTYFEVGYLAKAIREMAQLDLGMGEFKIDKVRIYFVFNPLHYTSEGAREIIEKIWRNKIYMEERTGFNERAYTMRKNEPYTQNAWIEIERGLFWTWEKITLSDLKKNFEHQVQFLDYRRAQRVRGIPELRVHDYDRKLHHVDRLNNPPVV